MTILTWNYLLHATETDCDEFDTLLLPIWQDPNGNIKWPFKAGTLRYVDCIPHPQNTGQCICLIDQRIIDLAQTTPAVASAIQNLLTLKQVQALGWFPDVMPLPIGGNI